MSPRVQTLNKCASATGAAFGFSEEDYAAVYRAPPRRFARVLAFLLVIAAGSYAMAQKLGLPAAVAQITGGNRVV
jgi:ABC-type spermidine/putrescine transport system permease subunit II